MPRLTSPTGVTVNVGEEKAAQLQSVGYRSADSAAQDEPGPEKAPTKKRAAKKPATKSDDE